MKTWVSNQRRYGLPEMGYGETYAFGRERYEDALREADAYRLEQRAAPAERAPDSAHGSPLARFLNWTRTIRASQQEC